MLPEALDGPRIWIGDGWSWPIEFYDDAALTVPTDLTNYGATWIVVAAYNSGEAVTGITVDETDASTGKLMLKLLGSQTADLVATKIHYELKCTDGDDQPFTLCYGEISVDGYRL